MKKVIIMLLIIISMFSFFILFNSEKQKANNNMEKVEAKLNNSYKILLPDEISNNDQTNIYNRMVEVLKKHKANIYYSRIGDTEELLKFIYLTDFSYFDNYRIIKGRAFNIDENESDKFLSSQNTGKTNQIGKLETFDGKNNFVITTLKSMVNNDKYCLNGYCTVQLSTGDNIDYLIKDLEKGLNVDGIETIREETFTSEYYYNPWILPSFYFIITLLILYSIIKSYKKYGVKLMLGYSSWGIWLNEVLPLLVVQCFIVLIINVFMSMYFFKEYNSYFVNFSKLLLIDSIEKTIIFFIVSSIPFIYLNNIKIGNMLKNKLPIKDVIIFNSIVKTMLIILFFMLINKGIKNFDRIKNVFNNNYKRWEDTKAYYVLPSMSTLANDIEMGKFIDMQVPLYNIINKEGAIMADFYLYSPAQRKSMISETSHDYERDLAIVNPNYLKSNIVYDIYNKPIYISEDETDFILLIPDKYKKNEIDIRNFYGKVYGATKRKQDIKIIYTMPNQKMFSYELDVYPNSGNFVTNSIIRVITEKNGEPQNYGVIIGYIGNPIKIKINASYDPVEYIKAKLKIVNLQKYVGKFSPVNEGVAFESKSVYDLLTFLVGSLLALAIAILIIIIQNIYCFFEEFKKHLAIRQFFGFKAIHKYKEYFLLFTVNWIVILIVNNLSGDLNITQIILTVLLMIIELAITLVVIKFVSKRKIISVIKGS
ncbi:MAG: DUF1430 domain-containing protein [Clostridiaceae bacterium]|nr:DUF1430 domain-containing protein [Clostridiaceae bacterium]